MGHFWERQPCAVACEQTAPGSGRARRACRPLVESLSCLYKYQPYCEVLLNDVPLPVKTLKIKSTGSFIFASLSSRIFSFCWWILFNFLWKWWGENLTIQICYWQIPATLLTWLFNWIFLLEQIQWVPPLISLKTT